MAKLVKAVFVRDPDCHRTVLLQPGEEPEQRLAALVTNPDAWEDGKLPDAASDASNEETDDSSEEHTESEAAPAAKKTAAKKATTSRSRGRDAADEGTSGD